MAEPIECDRCGNLVSHANAAAVIALSVEFEDVEQGAANAQISWVLCRSCVAGLRGWMAVRRRP